MPDEPHPIPSPAPHRRAWLALAGYWVLLAATTHWPRLDVTRGNNNLFDGAVQIDKGFHACGFAVLTWLLLRARPAGRGASPAATTLLATLLAAGYAAIDEWTQGPFGRNVTWSDFVASLIGVWGAAVIYLHHADPRPLPAWVVRVARLGWLIVLPLGAALLALPAVATISPFREIIWYFTKPGLGRDKFGHFLMALLLTWQLAASLPAGRRRPALGALVAILAIAASAPVIEHVQRFTDRGFEMADIYAHQLGLLAALGAWWAWSVGRRLLPRAADTAPTLTSGETAATASEGGVARAGFVGHALRVGVFTLASRITGLLRDSLLGSAFGVGAVADAFAIGFLVPNLFRRLFGEGALSAAFIPHYTELKARDPEIARRFASLCLTLLTVTLAGLTLVGELVIAALAAGGGADADSLLALRLTAIMLPYMPLICLVAIIGGVLQVHGRFGAPAAAPILLNVVMTAAILYATWGLDAAAGRPALADAARFLAWSVLVAGGAQLAWQVAALLRVTRLTAAFAGTGPTLRSMLVMMLPMLIGLAVFQLNTFFDSMIAWFLSARAGQPTFELFGRTVAYPMERGAVAALTYAQRLYQFPLGVFGIAVATAIFPALAAAAPREGATAAPDAFARILRQGLRLTVFIGLPATVGLILLSLPITRLIFERNAFTLDDSRYVAAIVAAYSASIWAYSMTHVLTRGFYALKDSKTPLRVSMAMIAVNLALNLTLIWPLGVVGLAASSAITAAGQAVLLLVAIRKRVPRPVDAYVLRGWTRTAALSTVMAWAIAPCLLLVDEATTGAAATAGLVAGLVLLGMTIVLVGAWLTGAEELAWLRRRAVK